MRWDNWYEIRRKENERQKSLVGVRRKKFAWTPVDTEDGKTVWLEFYFAVYEHVPCKDMIGGYIEEKYYVS